MNWKFKNNFYVFINENKMWCGQEWIIWTLFLLLELGHQQLWSNKHYMLSLICKEHDILKSNFLVRSLSSSPHPHLSNLYRNIWNIKLASNITLYITHLPVVIKIYFKVYCIKTYLISPFPQSFLIEDQLCLVIRMLINVSSVSIEVRSQQL
jgi:hypothetical protein